MPTSAEVDFAGMEVFYGEPALPRSPDGLLAAAPVAAAAVCAIANCPGPPRAG